MIGKNYSCDKRVHFLIQISRLSLKNYQFRTKKWLKIQFFDLKWPIVNVVILV